MINESTRINEEMEIPVLTRQVAEVVDMSPIPLLRQFSIPIGIESEPSPKPDELDPEDYAEKTADGMIYVAFNGHWYPAGDA